MTLGADDGDHICTLHCQLSPNHAGPHGAQVRFKRTTYSIYWSATPVAAHESLIVEDNGA